MSQQAERTGSDDASRPQPCPELLESWLDLPDAETRARHFRDVLGRFASGVSVVTAVRGGEPVGLTCQSFTSVSLDPPLVLVVPSRGSRTWPAIEQSGAFCVNILADDQRELSNTMAGRGPDKFAGLTWQPTEQTGSPRLAGTVAWVDCTVHAVHDGGDHQVVLGRVVDLGAAADPPGGAPGPLVFFRGSYTTTRPAGAGPTP